MDAKLAAQIAASPQTPGVYLLQDRAGSVLYVGKSINIRKRLLQHAAAVKAGWQERAHRRVHHIAGASWHETGSELYALLLEDQWIKRYWPIGNVRQKDYLEYAYLAFSTDPFPRLLVIDARQREARQHVFGPFRNLHHARDLAELIQERFRLRTCFAMDPAGCLQGAIGRCAAPCHNRDAAEAYPHAVARALASLRGCDPSVTAFITEKMISQAQKRAFERAAHYKSLLHRYHTLIRRQRFLERFRHHGLWIREKGRWPNTFVFLEGLLVEHNGVPAGPDPLAEEFSPGEWQLSDRAHVIYQWMHSRRTLCTAVFMDRRFFRAVHA